MSEIYDLRFHLKTLEKKQIFGKQKVIRKRTNEIEKINREN